MHGAPHTLSQNITAHLQDHNNRKHRFWYYRMHPYLKILPLTFKTTTLANTDSGITAHLQDHNSRKHRLWYYRVGKRIPEEHSEGKPA